MRSGTPTCGAARPMPGAAYIVSIMSSMSCCRLGVKRVDVGGAAACSGRVAVVEDRTNHRRALKRAARRGASASDARASARASSDPRSSRRRTSRAARRPARARPSLRRRRPRPARRRRRCARWPPGARSSSPGRPTAAASSASRSASCSRDAEVLAVGDAAFEAAGVVGRPSEAGRARASGSAAGSRRGRASRARTATSGPRPMPTALIAGIDISACASRPSSLRSHCT